MSIYIAIGFAISLVLPFPISLVGASAVQRWKEQDKDWITWGVDEIYMNMGNGALYYTAAATTALAGILHLILVP